MTGNEPMSERKFATMFNGIGSKGSWADFYRLAEAEYAATSRDDRGLSVIDLMDAEEVGEPIAPADIAVPVQVPAEQAPVPAPTRMEPVTAGFAKRAESLGMEFVGTVDGEDNAQSEAADEAPTAAVENDLKARMAALGME